MILGLLADRPDHAYALKQRLSPGLPRERLINDGVLYPLLAKLEDERLVTSSERRGERGRPRRVYSITRAGRAEFRRWLRSEEDEEGPPLHELFIAHPLQCGAALQSQLLHIFGALGADKSTLRRGLVRC